MAHSQPIHVHVHVYVHKRVGLISVMHGPYEFFKKIDQNI